jgi:general secretion pathway protein N
MSASGSFVSVALVVAALAFGGTSSATAANDPAAFDAPSGPVAPSAVDIGRDESAARPPARAREPRGNPLWAIPLSSLAATRERPLFLPSRRPPAAPAVAGPPVVVVPQPVEDPRPQLTLIGAIAGTTEGFAIFIDARNNAMIRLRTGQEHAGWTLTSVKGREVTLAKDRETAAFALPAPGGNGAPSAAPGVLDNPDASTVAAAASGDVMVAPRDSREFAPYTPRSTPKNGESDGL